MSFCNNNGHNIYEGGIFPAVTHFRFHKNYRYFFLQKMAILHQDSSTHFLLRTHSITFINWREKYRIGFDQQAAKGL